MILLEYLLIFIGISVEIFAIMQREGAMIPKIEWKALSIACVVITAIQLAFFFGGYQICNVLAEHDYLSDRMKDGAIVASFVFVFLGIRMIYKSIKQLHIVEHRKEIKLGEYIWSVVVSNFYTFFAGSACGLLSTSCMLALINIVVITVAAVIGGVYIGYRFGAETMKRSFYVGAVLFLVAGVDIIVHTVMGAVI